MVIILTPAQIILQDKIYTVPEESAYLDDVRTGWLADPDSTQAVQILDAGLEGGNPGDDVAPALEAPRNGQDLDLETAGPSENAAAVSEATGNCDMPEDSDEDAEVADDAENPESSPRPKSPDQLPLEDKIIALDRIMSKLPLVTSGWSWRARQVKILPLDVPTACSQSVRVPTWV